jgi:cap1 methyltransferase
LISAETFEPHYGVNGRDGDGDVFKEDNLLAFQKFVIDNTDGKGDGPKTKDHGVYIGFV